MARIVTQAPAPVLAFPVIAPHSGATIMSIREGPRETGGHYMPRPGWFPLTKGQNERVKLKAAGGGNVVHREALGGVAGIALLICTVLGDSICCFVAVRDDSC